MTIATDGANLVIGTVGGPGNLKFVVGPGDGSRR